MRIVKLSDKEFQIAINLLDAGVRSAGLNAVLDAGPVLLKFMGAAEVPDAAAAAPISDASQDTQPAADSGRKPAVKPVAKRAIKAAPKRAAKATKKRA